MMKRILALIAMVLSLSFLFCSCNSNYDDAGSTDVNLATSEDVPSQSTDSDDADTNSTAPENELTDEEIGWFNTNFFNNSSDIPEHPEQYIHNMLLSSTYETAAEIDLFALFYEGVGGPFAVVSEDELELLAEYRGDDAHMLDVAAFSSEEMDEILRKHLGLGLEETEQRGLDEFIYLNDYDRYYHVTGDTNYQLCTVTSGYRDADGMIVLQYEMGGKQYEVILHPTDECYLFVSNLDL